MVRCKIEFVGGKFVGVVKKQTTFTQKELNEFGCQIIKLNEYLEQLYNGEITLADIPAKWQEEIQRRVNERIDAEGEAAQQEISGEEFYSMIEEVL